MSMLFCQMWNWGVVYGIRIMSSHRFSDGKHDSFRWPQGELLFPHQNKSKPEGIGRNLEYLLTWKKICGNQFFMEIHKCTMPHSVEFRWSIRDNYNQRVGAELALTHHTFRPELLWSCNHSVKPYVIAVGIPKGFKWKLFFYINIQVYSGVISVSGNPSFKIWKLFQLRHLFPISSRCHFRPQTWP